MLLYDLLSYFSYFFILIVFLILAIVFAKKLFSWIFYGIGTILTLLSLIGNQNAITNYYYSFSFAQERMYTYWYIYFALSIIAAIVMIVRYNRAKNNYATEKYYICEKCKCKCNKVTYMEIHSHEGIKFQYWCNQCLDKYNQSLQLKQKNSSHNHNTCTFCGEILSDESKFCGKCGNPINHIP